MPMTQWKKTRLRPLVIAWVVLTASCNSDPNGETELQARAQADIAGMQTSLAGQFRTEAEGQRLTGELDNRNVPTGTAISFCLVQPSGTTALAAPETNAQGVAQFELNTQNGQAVPKVSVGDKIEAHQGATNSGGADCSAPLLVSATFHVDMDQPNH
jgi:hypothetical protein